jgi:predicted GIY-YIG superfamily endonuclease
MRAMYSGSYFTYMMASRSHTLYIGVTGNLQKRVFEQKWKEHDGFTARYNCDRLVVRELSGCYEGNCAGEAVKGMESE